MEAAEQVEAEDSAAGVDPAVGVEVQAAEPAVGSEREAAQVAVGVE